MTDSSIRNNQTMLPEDDDIGLLDIGLVIAENLRLLVFGPVAVGVIALGISFLITPTFTARISFLPPQQQQSAATAMLSQLGALSGLAASAAGLKNPADQYVALLKSVAVADRLIVRFKLMELYDVKIRADARKILTNSTIVYSSKDGLIIVEVDDKSPQRAADMASAYVDELRSMLGSLALTEAQQRRVFFERQLEQTKVKLTAAEVALGSIGVSANTIKSDPKVAVESVVRLGAQVTAQEVKLAAMRGYLTETAPEFRQAQLALAALRTQLTKSETGGNIASSVGGYIEKYREFKYQEALFELFARQFELAKVDEAREGALIQVVDPALPPERKSKPTRAMIAVVATLVAGFVFLAWVILRTMLENAKRHPEEASKLAVIRNRLVGLFAISSK
jgi:uncharacterized protein involved in exopolysaccharide biosynthesis